MAAKFKILIADDSALQRQLLADTLACWGYEVFAATDGREALALFKAVRPDVLILDGIMPEIDGYDVCKCIKNMPSGEKVPILLITAHNSSRAVMKAFEAGADEYLSKPLNRDILQFRLERILTASCDRVELEASRRHLETANRALHSNEKKFEALFNNALVGICMLDNAGCCLYANQKWLELFGYSRDEVVGLDYQSYTMPADQLLSDDIFTRLKNGEDNEFHVEKRYVRKDKTIFWGSLSVSGVYDDADKLWFTVSVVADISDWKSQTHLLRESEARLAETQRIAHLGTWQMEFPERLMLWSDETFRILGLEPQPMALPFDAYVELLHPDDKLRYLKIINQAQTDGRAYNFAVRHRWPDGIYHDAMLRFQPVENGAGLVVRLVGSILDITEYKDMERQLQRRNALLVALNNVSVSLFRRAEVDKILQMIVSHVVALFDEASCGLYLLDEDMETVELRFAQGLLAGLVGRVQNKADGPVGKVFISGRSHIIENYQLSETEAVGTSVGAVMLIGLPLRCGGTIVGVIQVMLPGGDYHISQEEQIMLERFASLASLAYDNAFLYQQAQREITERRMAEAKLRHISFHDVLTGLYNRAFFENEIARCRDSECQLGIIVCDIDGLKQVNDSYGHAAGDMLISMAGNILRRSFDASVVIARIGGDEFAVLLPGADEFAVQAAERRIVEHSADYQLPCGTAVSISVGSAAGNTAQVSVDDMFKAADKNMYADKMSRRVRQAMTDNKQ